MTTSHRKLRRGLRETDPAHTFHCSRGRFKPGIPKTQHHPHREALQGFNRGQQVGWWIPLVSGEGG